MSYTKSYHAKALHKIVKEKRMILQVEAGEIMNRPNIQYAAQKLEKEGKIKRQKIKARYKNGNLNDVWLLTLPEVRYEEILGYEVELVNRPYESPLKVHHCYKSKDDDVKSNITDEEIQLPANVININDHIRVNSHQLDIMEYRGQRVITFQDIDRVHERPTGTARKRFNDNKKRFIENVDYFIVKPSDIQKSENRTSGINSVNNAGTYFITESGYLMVVKSLTDNLAWDVQRKLVEGYFRLKEILNVPAVKETLPQMKFDTLDMFEILVKEMKNQRNRIAEQDNKIIELESKFEALKDVL